VSEAALASYHSGMQSMMSGRNGQGSNGNLNAISKELISQYGVQNVQHAVNTAAAESLGAQLDSFIDSLPMPQFMQDDAKSAVDDVLSQYTDQSSAEGLQEGVDHVLGNEGKGEGDRGTSASGDDTELSSRSEGSSSAKDAVAGTMDMIKGEMMEELKGANKGGNTSGGGPGNWLALLARALGKTAGSHLKKMVELGEKMGELDSKENPEEFAKIQAEFQAESQVFKMFQEAIGTMVKSIGEGLSSVARKQ